ncbi:Flagellar M-ring protein [Buchnera aphidicola (Chaitophorus sp. 3695)]|uniref:hypothetical protein n=1 Tax=Buchnera aphidicola TaxID=9 RepID=UPI003463EFFC
MNFYFQDNKHIKKKSCIFNIFLYLLHTKKTIFLIFFFTITIFFSLFFWIKSINYKIIYKNLCIKNSKKIIKKLINLKISYKDSKIEKSLCIPADQINIFNIDFKNIKLTSNFRESKLFNLKRFKIRSMFNNKINNQDILEKELLKNIKKLSFINHTIFNINFYENDLILDACNESFALILVNINTQKNIISKDFLDAIISLICTSIPNFPKKNIIFLNKFGELLYLKKNILYTKENYRNIYDISLIQNIYKNNIENFVSYSFRKKNTLDKIIIQGSMNQSNYKNNFYKLYKKNFINSKNLNLFKSTYTFNNNYINNTLKENKKNYSNIILSNSCKKYDVKQRFHELNFYQYKKYDSDFKKKKILKLIDLNASNLEDSNYKFDNFKSNLILDIKESTPSSMNELMKYKKDNENKYIFLVNNEVFNIKNLIKDVVGCSMLRDDSIEILNCNYIEPENYIISYIPIKKNESVDRTLHLVPWFILFFFIILLITSFFSFKKLTKKIQDSNINIMYNLPKNFKNT